MRSPEVTLPLKVKLLVPPIAPPPNTILFAKVKPVVLACRVPALMVMSPEPAPDESPKLNVPALSVVPPEYVFTPDKVSVLTFCLMSEPAPLMTPLESDAAPLMLMVNDVPAAILPVPVKVVDVDIPVSV